MSMTYNDLVNALKNLLVDQTPSTDFTGILPSAIQYAEDRIYRELDLLAERIADFTDPVTAGTRGITCPTTISIVEGVALLTPAGQTPPSARRNVLERASLDFIDFMYGDESAVSVPTYFSMLSDVNIVLAPTPDSAYILEVTGTAQPQAMTSLNQSTWLGDNVPDLLLAAAMVFMTGWQKNYGAQSDDPQMSQSWENQYKTLMTSAQEFVQRQKSQDPNWSPFSPTPLSTPRG